jgi:hypothetical protein
MSVISNIVTGIGVATSIKAVASSAAGGNYNPMLARLGISGLPVGGGYSPSSLTSNFGFKSANGSSTASSEDWRVRISLSPNSNIFYKDGGNSLMAPLRETDGVIFPYLPTITVTHTASYSSQSITHSNYTPQFYQNSDVSDITIQGEFTVQNPTEGQYLLAAIYFFRASSKMFFGNQTRNQGFSGNPPPLLFLDGYGTHYFPHVTCVLSSFSHTMAPDVDYISVPGSSGNSTRMPTSSSISITLKPVYSRKNLHDNFGLSDFASGKLLGSANAGGFL